VLRNGQSRSTDCRCNRIQACDRVAAVNEKIRLTRSLRVTAMIVVAVLLISCSGSPNQVQLSMPDLSNIPDGVYRGSAKVLPVIARVEVTVTGGRITGFRILRHLTGKGQSAETLAEKVVEKQTIELDTVSGATYSSKVILKAGENALRSGLTQE
jgi:uncharacterized protein with FMN-binding domain